MNEERDSWLAGKLPQSWGESRQQLRSMLFWGKCFQQLPSWTVEPWWLLIPRPTGWLPHIVLSWVGSLTWHVSNQSRHKDGWTTQWTRQTNRQTLHRLNGAHTTEEGALAESDTWETRNGIFQASTATSKGGGGHKRWQHRSFAVVCKSATQTPGCPEVMPVYAFSPRVQDLAWTKCDWCGDIWMGTNDRNKTRKVPRRHGLLLHGAVSESCASWNLPSPGLLQGISMRGVLSKETALLL